MSPSRLMLTSVSISIAAGAAVFAAPANAAIVVTTTPATTWQIQARARRGGASFEGELRVAGGTPLNPSMNPTGTPAWVAGRSNPFRFEYQVATGASTWSIDFNNDGDFLDSSESVSSVNAAYIGKSFKYTGIFVDGFSAASAMTVDSLIINGSPFGPYFSDGPQVQVAYEDTSGSFGNIVATGAFTFSNPSVGTTEEPRFWFRASTPVDPVPGPLPALGGAVALAWSRKMRRRIRESACSPRSLAAVHPR